MPNKEPALSFLFGNGLLRVGTKGLFRPCLKTFLVPFLSTRLTAASSPRMENVITKVYYKVQWTVITNYNRCFITNCDSTCACLIKEGGNHPSLLILDLPRANLGFILTGSL